MAVKPNATVCGIPTRVGGRINYGAGHIAHGTGHIGSRYAISKPGAKRLLKALFGHERLPRPGYEILLCDKQYLVSMSGDMQIVRRDPGDLKGSRRRRRR